MPTYPVSRPSASGTDITVDLYSKQPLMMLRTIQSFVQADYFLSDLMFSPGGTAPSGSVAYEQVIALDDQFASIGNGIEDVGPGDEFPVIGASNIAPSIALTQKRGAKMKITREMITRNEIAKFRNQTQAMYNSCKRQDDVKAIAAVTAASTLSQAESASWATYASTLIRNDIAIARALVENTTLGKAEGYHIDTMVLGSTQWLNVMLNAQLMNTFYQANMGTQAAQLVNNGILDGLLGIPKVRLNPFLTATDRWLFDSSRVGARIDEYGLELESWYDNPIQSTWYQLSKSNVYIVTDPKALVKIV